MSEHDPEPAQPAPPPAAVEPVPATEPARARKTVRRGGTPLLLTLLLTGALGGGLYWVWMNPRVAIPGGNDQDPAVGQQLQALTSRVDALEKPAAPSPAVTGSEADLAKRLDEVADHVDSLSAKQEAQAAEIRKTQEIAAQKPADAGAPTAQPDATASQIPALIAQQQAADTALAQQRAQMGQAAADQQSALGRQKAELDALGSRLATLEGGSRTPDRSQDVTEQKSALDALGQRLATLEQASGQASEQKSTLDALGQRLATLEQANGRASERDQAARQDQGQTESLAKSALASLDARVGKLEQGAGAVRGVAQDASRAIRLEAAQTALAIGQPLGDLPGAPAALTRFATIPPPTESGLRAAFPAVAEAARAASRPDLSQRSFLDRALARMQQSVTVRRGDHVIVGDPAGGVLARAQQALDDGDLKGAAGALGGLDGSAAAAVQGWVAQVRALLDARAALAAMARG